MDINIINSIDFILSENMDTEHIVYIAGGLLGDFFSQLSVIKENYIKHNKKGLLYISDIRERFRNPLETVYNDTYDIVIKQEYIHDYKIYNGENYHIDLSSWRNNSLLFRTSFHEIYKSEYNVDWGKNKWINGIPYDEKWKNIVLINTVPYRFKNYIDYNEYLLKYPEFKFVFISIDRSHYDCFISYTNMVNIEYYCPQSLYDAAIAINSCEFLMGATSALLCIAYSMHKKSITIDSCADLDNVLHGNMQFLNTNYIQEPTVQNPALRG
jgi:hypothetical protein